MSVLAKKLGHGGLPLTPGIVVRLRDAAAKTLKTLKTLQAARMARVMAALVACAVLVAVCAACGSGGGDAESTTVSSAAIDGGAVGGEGANVIDVGDGPVATGSGLDEGPGAGNGAGGSGGSGGAGGVEGAGGGNAGTVHAEPTYSQEDVERRDRFLAAMEGLPMDDVASAKALYASFGSVARADGPNDPLFFAYEAAMQSIGDSFNDSILESGLPGDAFVMEATENGFLFVNEAANPHFSLRPDFIHDTFSSYVSQTVGDMLFLRKKHYEFAGGHEFLENETIMVTLDQLAEMIVDWEGYLDSASAIHEADDIKNNLDFYLKVYLGSYQIENSGFYVDVGLGVDGSQILKLADEPRQSYLLFAENYGGSAYWPLVGELLQVYEASDFLYSADIEAFFARHGLTVPV